MFCLTKGERGLSPEVSFETASTREKEEKACCGLLGVEPEFFGLIDGEVFASREACSKVADRLKVIKPRAVFTTWHVENHPDHAAACEIAVKACRLAGLYDTVEIHQAEEGAGGQTMGFDPSIYVDISSVMDRKLEMIRCHVCQNKNDELARQAIEQSSFRGRLSRCDYAEAWRPFFPMVSGRRGRSAVPVLLEL
jgi:LmbE family N-acetylglucosaminyl deacetylase